MSRRLLLCVAFLALALGSIQPAGAAPAKTSPAARYKGTYFFFVLNFQQFFQYGGVFTIATSGAVNGKLITGNSTLGNDTVYPISGNIVNPSNGGSQGRFAVDLVDGDNITTVTIGATSVGQLVGRQEFPATQIYPLSGSMYNIFFPQAGLYTGTTNDGRALVLTTGLQRRISGSFEQEPGNFTALFGGANLAGLNGRSYLAKTFFNATYFTPITAGNITATGTWRQNSPTDTGTFTVKRVNP